MGSADSTTFAGRADELRRLDALCSAAAAGHGGLAVVSGEAGIGKTRFCGEVARRADRSGLRVVTARLAAACARAPVCLVVDDPHAADAGTRLLVRFVTRSLDRLPLALVVTRRTGAPPPGSAWARPLDEVEREAVPVVLRRFDLAETAAFLSDHAGGGAPSPFRRLRRRRRPGPHARPDPGLGGARTGQRTPPPAMAGGGAVIRARRAGGGDRAPPPPAAAG